MATPPDNEGIMKAMKSMKTIVGQQDKNGSQTTVPPSFPRPPVDLIGTIGNANKNKKVGAVGKKKTDSVATTTKKKKTGVASTTPKTSLQTPPPPPTTTPDTNSQLFGTLVNSLKTGPVDQVKSTQEREKPRHKAFSKSGKTTKTKKSYASSSSCSTTPSISTSSSSKSSSISSISSASSASSNSVPSSQSEHSSLPSDAGKLAREKKKRKEELLHEKVEMLTRITNLAKNGFTKTKEWDMKDDIDEIRYECYRMQRESNSKKSIKIMRRVLITITTLVETGNSYFNPFNLRLEGFSESMMLNLDDYDDCFEQIHHKYSGRSSVGPEMQILFTFMSAAIFHHAGNAIGRGHGRGSSAKKKPSASPMSSVMSMMGMLNGANMKTSSNFPVPRSTPPPKANASANAQITETDKPKRKTMRGPGASSIPSSLLGKSQTTPSMVLSEDA